MSCPNELFRNFLIKPPEGAPVEWRPPSFRKRWFNPNTGLEEYIEVYCDGETHFWKDNYYQDQMGWNWVDKCPRQKSTKKEQRIHKYIERPFYWTEFDLKYNGANLKIIQDWYRSGVKKLLILGPRTTGKTLSSKMLFTDLVEKGERVVFYTNLQIQEMWHKVALSDYDAVEENKELWRSSYVVIDDLGYPGEKDFFITKFKDLLDRYPGRIIITSNCTWPGPNTENPFRYEDRILRRLREGTRIVDFTGKPYPIKEK